MKADLSTDDDVMGQKPGALGGGSGRSFARGLALGLAIGGLCTWFVFRPSNETATAVIAPVERPNSPVTRETYTKIRPGMSSWEVHDMLGSGEVIGEQGMIVDENGQYRKWENLGRRVSNSSGTVSDHDGQPREDVRRTVRWSNGKRMITVVFHNDSVVEKIEENLY
ncbi:hypothetical protein [Tautonia marina]|uniref:hypothetical protein n=1 Tax=Tautonia marina TaxID=2653855 RepID=UPI001260FC61|nr:hypothetical protein [Tautonia marina]